MPRLAFGHRLLTLSHTPARRRLTDAFGHPLHFLGSHLDSGVDPQVLTGLLERGLASRPDKFIIRRTPGERPVSPTSNSSSPG